MGKNSGWSLRKTAFWTIVIIALMYLVAFFFAKFGANKLASIATYIRLIAEVVSLFLVAIMAWGYVRAHNPSTVWVVLYIIVMLIAIVFIVLPIVW